MLFSTCSPPRLNALSRPVFVSWQFEATLLPPAVGMTIRGSNCADGDDDGGDDGVDGETSDVIVLMLRLKSTLELRPVSHSCL